MGTQKPLSHKCSRETQCSGSFGSRALSLFYPIWNLGSCKELAEAVQADQEILSTAGKILALPTTELGFQSLPNGARHIKTGSSHSVAYLGRTQGENRHVVLSVHRNHYFIGDRRSHFLEERLSGFDYISNGGQTTPLCVVSIPRNPLRVAGIILEDVTQGGELELYESADTEYVTVLDPRGSYNVFIDPDGWDTDLDVGRVYLDALHIKL